MTRAVSHLLCRPLLLLPLLHLPYRSLLPRLLRMETSRAGGAENSQGEKQRRLAQDWPALTRLQRPKMRPQGLPVLRAGRRSARRRSRRSKRNQGRTLQPAPSRQNKTRRKRDLRKLPSRVRRLLALHLQRLCRQHPLPLLRLLALLADLCPASEEHLLWRGLAQPLSRAPTLHRLQLQHRWPAQVRVLLPLRRHGRTSTRLSC